MAPTSRTAFFPAPDFSWGWFTLLAFLRTGRLQGSSGVVGWPNGSQWSCNYGEQDKTHLEEEEGDMPYSEGWNAERGSHDGDRSGTC